MKNLSGAAFLLGAALLTTAATQAQTLAPAPAPAAKPTRAGRQQPPQRQLTPEEEAHEQQMRLLEARTGNTSLGAGNNNGYRQTEKGNGGFTLRKFKEMPGQEQKRGTSKRVQMGATTSGEPLKYGRRKRNFF